MKHYLVGIFLFLISLSSAIKAQQARLFKPSLTLNYTFVPESKLIDSVGTFSNQGAQFGLFIPIYNHLNLGDSTKKLTYFQLMGNVTGRWSSADLTNILNKQDLLGATAGLTAFLVRNRKNIFLVSGSSMLRNDIYTIDQPEIRYAGVAQYRRNVNKGFSFHAGLVYSYFIGRGILFPSLGLSFKTGKYSRMIINFPNRISYVQNVGKKLRVSLYYRPQGGFNFISNKSDNAKIPSELYLRQRESHLGLNGIFKIGSNFNAVADIGYALRRNILLTESLQKKSLASYQSEINNGIYFGIGVKYIFHSTKKDKESSILSTDAEKEELISDPDFYDIIEN